MMGNDGIGYALDQGTLVSGRYRLEEELARGGMGCLWIASDQRLRRRVAIKFILSRSRPKAAVMERFEREARAAAQLESPHIVQIHDFGDDQGHVYMVMELLHGEDLSQRLARQTVLSVDEVGTIVKHACKGLGVIHAAGMLHRDLKPGNLFLATVDGAEIVKIIDFGVVLTPDSQRGAEGLLGTTRYMSPEQFTDPQAIDARSDLWSLAVIAYRALTGHTPFDAPSITARLVKMGLGAHVPPTQLVSGLPAAADAFFKRALSYAPEARFASAEELAAAFAEVNRKATRTTLTMGTPKTASAVMKHIVIPPPPMDPDDAEPTNVEPAPIAGAAPTSDDDETTLHLEPRAQNRPRDAQSTPDTNPGDETAPVFVGRPPRRAPLFVALAATVVVLFSCGTLIWARGSNAAARTSPPGAGARVASTFPIPTAAGADAEAVVQSLAASREPEAAPQVTAPQGAAKGTRKASAPAPKASAQGIYKVDDLKNPYARSP